MRWDVMLAVVAVFWFSDGNGVFVFTCNGECIQNGSQWTPNTLAAHQNARQLCNNANEDFYDNS